MLSLKFINFLKYFVVILSRHNSGQHLANLACAERLFKVEQAVKPVDNLINQFVAWQRKHVTSPSVMTVKNIPVLIDAMSCHNTCNI